MKVLCGIVLGIFLLGTISTAQSYTVNGYAIDKTTKETLLSASVIAVNQADSLLAAFSITNNQGQFKIENLKAGTYAIQITYLGYEQYEKIITLNNEIGDLDIGDCLIISKSEIIDGVVIEGEQVPIKMKKDTLVYNADAFKTRPNDNVEELLKRMPGIEVDEDGTITAQGEEVQQVLVEGKEFFGSDPKIATRNLPAKAIDEVEVFDQKSEQAEFSGIDDGERQKTINLNLKEDYKKGYFGNITAGYGTDERHLGKLSINRFDKKSQISLLGNLNNINQQGFSVDDYISFVGGMGNFRGSRGQSDVPINRGLSDGFVNTLAGGINYNYEFNDKTELRSNYFINNIENNIAQLSNRESFLRTGSYFSNNTSDQQSQNTNHKINAEIRHEIDSTSDLRIRAGLNINRTDVWSTSFSETLLQDNELQNQQDQDYTSDGKRDNISSSLLYRKKSGAKQRRVFSLDASVNTIDHETLQDIVTNNIFYPRDGSLEMTALLVQDHIENNDQSNYSIRTNLTEPLGNGNYLDLNYRFQNYSNEVIKDVFDIDQGISTFNIPLSNSYNRDYSFHRATMGWNLNKEKLVLTTELAFQHSNLDGNIITENTLIQKTFNNFLPSLRLRYDIAQSKNLRFDYNTSIREPSLEQLQPYIDNTDPLNIYVGNPDLQAEFRHRFQVRFMDFNQFSLRSFFVFFNATYTTDKIINQKTIDSRFVETTTPINVDNDLSVNTSISYSTPIRPIGAKIRLSTRLGYGNSTLFINATQNQRKNYSSSLGLTIENRNKEHIDISVGTNLRYNTNSYSVDDNLNQSFVNQSYFTEMSYVGSESWGLSTALDYSIYNNDGLDADQRIPIWKASISKFILANQRGELKLAAFDILNKNQGINLSSNLNYTQYQSIESLGRYFLLSFTYQINAFGSAGNVGGGGRSGRRGR